MLSQLPVENKFLNFFTFYSLHYNVTKICTFIFAFFLQNCSYACEGEKAWLQCQPYEAIRILRVFWGREDDQLANHAQICGDPPLGLKTSVPCESIGENGFKKVKNQCQNREGICSVL